MWSRSLCPLLVLMAVLDCEAKASHVGKGHGNVEHRVEKVQIQVTALPAFARKREATMCASDYNLCPASLQGGCCPDRYECATDACYATTAGTTSACGRAGYYFCPASIGGCCPEGKAGQIASISILLTVANQYRRLHLRCGLLSSGRCVQL
jgi:hypothetical protein